MCDLPAMMAWGSSGGDGLIVATSNSSFWVGAAAAAGVGADGGVCASTPAQAKRKIETALCIRNTSRLLVEHNPSFITPIRTRVQSYFRLALRERMHQPRSENEKRPATGPAS